MGKKTALFHPYPLLILTQECRDERGKYGTPVLDINSQHRAPQNNPISGPGFILHIMLLHNKKKEKKSPSQNVENKKTNNMLSVLFTETQGKN